MGVLDIGSNTVHLLLVDAHYGAAPIPASKLKIPLRLAEHLTPDGEVDDVAVATLIEFIQKAQNLSEDLGVSEDVIGHPDDASGHGGFDVLAAERFQDALAEHIARLPEREALVLSLYYDEELNLREIGEVLSVSESRVSQIHSQAMHRLRARLRDWNL